MPNKLLAMKTNKFIRLATITSVLLMVSATSKSNDFNASAIEKSVVEISDSLFAGQFEVSNHLYKIFLKDLEQNKQLNDLAVAQIDSNGWIRKPVYIESLVHEYHNSEKYEKYPVVNISFEGAKLFCAWLTKKYNSFPDKNYEGVEFFLPNEKEWILAARGKNESVIYSTGKSLINEKGMQMANYRRTDIPLGLDVAATAAATIDTGEDVEVGEILAPVESYWKNESGIYNLSGNAAEMISVKGILKGGSFKDESEQLKLDAKQSYKAPASYIGFRYFMRKK